MQIYTQIVRPSELDEDDLWIPCLKTFPVKHSPAAEQPLIITHIEAINHYAHSINKLLEQKVYAVGAKTYDRLVEAGFAGKKIYWRHRADELKFANKTTGPITWLRGDKYARDFSAIPQVTTFRPMNPNQIRMPSDRY